MKKSFAFICIGCFFAGILTGGLLPRADKSPSPPPPVLTANASVSADGAAAPALPEPLNSSENFPLLNTACCVVRALREGDYPSVAAMLHPERGVTFTPYSTVNFETDLTFTADQIRELNSDTTVYTWGFKAGQDTPIQATLPRYLQSHVFGGDSTQAPLIAVDRVLLSGNALENLTEAYPGCRFVDFSFPGRDPASQGTDWRSLKLVFEPSETDWLLVGIIHSEWIV